MKLTTSVESRTEVTLTPEVGARLVATLDTYHELVMQRKILEAQIETEKAMIGEIVFATGYEALGIANSKITYVRGVTTTLDQKKLIADGVTLAQLAAATTTKPKKPYWKISGDGEE
jgi:hypothetical protein